MAAAGSLQYLEIHPTEADLLKLPFNVPPQDRRDASLLKR